MQADAKLRQVVAEFRRMLPADTATARAIDSGDSWEHIAINAINDGYIETASELEQLIEACLRRSA